MKNTLGRVSQKWKGRVSGVAAGMCAALASLGTSDAQNVTINVVNHYDNTKEQYTDYFGNYYNDDQVWLYFLNTGGNVSYTASPSSGSSGTQTVTDAVAVKLSAVQNGSFNLAIPQSSTKVYAGFGATNPFSGTNGPGLYDTNVPYAVAEWTVTGTSYDNLDVSYLDSVSFPTKMTIKNSSNVTTSTTSFRPNTTAASIISALKTKTGMTGPNGPDTDNKPSEGQIGYGPEVPTVTGQTNPEPVRWIGSSKYWISGPDADNDRGLYTYAPSLNDYLGYLKASAPTTTVGTGENAQQVKGWFIDYSGNNGYSGFMNVTGEDGNYGMTISNIRVNTGPTAANDWLANPNAGTAITGEIIIAANGSTIPYNFAGSGDPPDIDDITGLWLDAVIYSAADILGDGSFATGPVISATGDLAKGGAYNSIVPSFMASISASMGTGLLGSDLYLDKYNGLDGSKGSTMYWFNEITRAQVLAELFAKGTWGGEGVAQGLEYFDVFWGTMADLSGMQGYLSPFSDRYANLSPDVGFFAGDTATWELGILAIPEPGTASLLLISALGGAFLMRRGRRQEA